MSEGAGIPSGRTGAEKLSVPPAHPIDLSHRPRCNSVPTRQKNQQTRNVCIMRERSKKHLDMYSHPQKKHSMSTRDGNSRREATRKMRACRGTEHTVRERSSNTSPSVTASSLTRQCVDQTRIRIRAGRGQLSTAEARSRRPNPAVRSSATASLPEAVAGIDQLCDCSGSIAARRRLMRRESATKG